MKTLETHYKKHWITHWVASSLIFFCSAASAEFRHFNDWTKKEKVSFAAYNTLTYMDYSQTKRALSHPCGCYVEANPIFGKDPHPDRLAIANVLASAYLYRYLGNEDPDGGLPALWIVSGMRVSAIIHNDQVGISWKVAF